jgi:hypothetical protein
MLREKLEEEQKISKPESRALDTVTWSIAGALFCVPTPATPYEIVAYARWLPEAVASSNNKYPQMPGVGVVELEVKAI